MKKTEKLLFFISSLIPGGGQMYQGYMKRGLSLMLVFCCIIAVASLLYMGELAIFLPVVWLYAFFDSYDLRHTTASGAAAKEDSFLFGVAELDAGRLGLLFQKRHSLIGWALVAVGVYAFYSTALRGFRDVFGRFDLWWLYRLCMYDVPRVVATLVIIGLGVWFIRGPRRKGSAEEIPVFTPGADRESAQEEAVHGEQ